MPLINLYVFVSDKFFSKLGAYPMRMGIPRGSTREAPTLIRDTLAYFAPVPVAKKFSNIDFSTQSYKKYLVTDTTAKKTLMC